MHKMAIVSKFILWDVINNSHQYHQKYQYKKYKYKKIGKLYFSVREVGEKWVYLGTVYIRLY